MGTLKRGGTRAFNESRGQTSVIEFSPISAVRIFLKKSYNTIVKKVPSSSIVLASIGPLQTKSVCYSRWNGVSLIETDCNHSRQTMFLLCILIMLPACLNFSFSSEWLPSAANMLADAGSGPPP